MLRKAHYQPKTGNIAKVKYFLPPSTENRYEAPEHEQNRLDKIKRSINNKYKASYSGSKPSSKRQSVSKIQHPRESLNSEINLNDDVSFEIVGIRDAQQIPRAISKVNENKKYRYPLGDSNTDLSTILKSKTKQFDFGLTFGSQKDKQKVFQSSKTISGLSKMNDFQTIAKKFPKPEEKQQFEKFLNGLIKDENYQNMITMFTIMYFYEQKAKKKGNS